MLKVFGNVGDAFFWFTVCMYKRFLFFFFEVRMYRKFVFFFFFEVYWFILNGKLMVYWFIVLCISLTEFIL